MKLKIFTFVTGLLIALCAQAQTSGTTGPLTWNYDPGIKTLSITGTGDMPDYSYDTQPWKAIKAEIQNVTIGDGVNKIGQSAFTGCMALQNITISSSVTTIGNYAFMQCDALQSITIPATVSTLGDDVFTHCRSLQSIMIPASVTTIGNSCFYGCRSLTSIAVDESNPAYKSIAGVLFTKDGTKLIQYPIEKPETEYTIPEGVKTIEESAFAMTRILNKITIPTSVNNIGDYAFVACKMLSEVIVSWETPLAINPNIFRDVPLSTATLKVPAGKVADYQAAPVWKDFGTITDGIAVTNIAGADLRRSCQTCRLGGGESTCPPRLMKSPAVRLFYI